MQSPVEMIEGKMEYWNTWLFLQTNATAASPKSLILLARFLAATSVPVAIVCLAGLWIWGSTLKRAAILAATAGLLAAMTVNLAIGLVWFHPRPFMLGIGHQLMPHAPETSFPSDHATFLWSLGLSLVLTRERRRWGYAIAVLGLATAWARVYLGVHFPVDMAGSLLVALGGSLLAKAVQPFLRRVVLPPVQQRYEALLQALHLSPALFPRYEVTDPAPTGRGT
jgi:undecaprenyl-diphosphatase